MGRRKLRLSSVKNYERKKYQKHSLESCGVTTCNATELIVRLPLSAYVSSPVTTSDSLFERLRQLLLPSGWFFSVEEREGTVSKSFDYGTVKMTINSESLWALEVGGNVLSLPSNTLPIFLTGQLTSCNQVFQILKNVDQSRLCIGNPDPKFSGVCDQRGGKFLGHSGMTVAYYDTRSLPSPTIRTSICCYFVTEGSLRCIVGVWH